MGDQAVDLSNNFNYSSNYINNPFHDYCLSWINIYRANNDLATWHIRKHSSSFHFKSPRVDNYLLFRVNNRSVCLVHDDWKLFIIHRFNNRRIRSVNHSKQKLNHWKSWRRRITFGIANRCCDNSPFLRGCNLCVRSLQLHWPTSLSKVCNSGA